MVITIYRAILEKYYPKKYKRLLRKEREAEEARLDELEAELEMAEESQKDSSPWSVKYYTTPCPYCGHYKVRATTFDDKRLSIAFWGILSHKIGKRFKCDRCGKVW